VNVYFFVRDLLVTNNFLLFPVARNAVTVIVVLSKLQLWNSDDCPLMFEFSRTLHQSHPESFYRVYASAGHLPAFATR